MGPISFLFVVFLVFFCPAQGSSAVTPLFVEKGKDVFLKVQEADIPAKFTILIWFHNKDVLVTFGSDKKPEVTDEYSGRIDVNQFSLTLKNLKEADSGVYFPRLTGKTKETTLARYNVTVQYPVSPAELSVDNVSKSAELCVVTVTCSTQDSRHINASFRCDAETCSEEDGGPRSVATTSGASLRLYLSDDLTITCNHSNQVGSKWNMTKIEPFCRSDSVASKLYITVIVVVAVVTIIAIVSAVKRRTLKQNKGEIENPENTVYACALIPTASRPIPAIEAPANTEDENVSSVYDQVQVQTRS